LNLPKTISKPAFDRIGGGFGARLGQMLLTLLGASVLIWALLPLAPGDPAQRTLEAMGNENPRPVEVEAMRDRLQLDRPLAAQYLAWLGRALVGDLSVSWQSGKPVSAELAKRLPATARLAVITLLLSVALALALALVGASFQGRWPDAAVRFVTQLGSSLPAFLLGLLLLQFIVIRYGMGRVVSSGSFGEVWFPALCLSLGRASEWAQLLRAGLLDALCARYTLVAAARGAARRRILLRYALPNALLPFLTVVGTGIGRLLGGIAVVEVVFSWPGLGSFAVTAITARDLPVIQGYVIFCTLGYVLASLLADLMSALLDPRLREREAG
jgi:ABC-type dipeptide/oligopeptide/nickel transport system permease component